jgi:rubrerythrin
MSRPAAIRSRSRDQPEAATIARRRKIRKIGGMSRAPVCLASLFAAVLAGPSGCNLLFGPCDASDREETMTVDPTALATALADGSLTRDECELLCDGGTLSTGSSGPNSPTTSGAHTSTGVDTGITDTGTTATGTNTDASTTSTATSTGDTTTATSTGDSTTATSTGDSTTATSTGGTTGAVTREQGGGARRTDPGARAYAGQLEGCSKHAEPGSIVCVYAGQDCSSGRRPAGLRALATSAVDGLGAWLAGAAYLEAASVPAFERLADELRARGAPEVLRSAALAAADDERRHAEAMTAQARRFGVAVATPALAAPEPRTLVALALENAIEGCVRETWAALLAAHQAQSAEDPALRSLMAAIADDERRHAELAWAIDAWTRTRLSPAELAAVDAARAAAADTLRPGADPPEALRRPLGLPSLTRAEPMWQALAATLWAA